MRQRTKRFVHGYQILTNLVASWCLGNRHKLIGLSLLIVPVIGVIWVAGLPGSKTPNFVNLAIDAGCNTNVNPVVHVHIPDTSARSRDLINDDSQARVAIQLVSTLAADGSLQCSYVRLNSSVPLISPMALTSLKRGDSPPFWFYVDAANSFATTPLSVDKVGEHGFQMSVPSEILEDFAGAILFELGEGIESTGRSTSTLSVSMLLSGAAAPSADTSAAASLTLPPDHRLIQDLSIPSAVNVLASNRGPRYEFNLQESHLGNSANGGHWVSFHTVIEDTVWAKWQEYLLFLFSGLFGFGVGFLFESLLARRSNEKS